MAASLKEQIGIAEAWAADRPDDVEANEGVAQAYQELEAHTLPGAIPRQRVAVPPLPPPPPPPQPPPSVALAWDEAENAADAKSKAVDIYLSFATLMRKSDPKASATWKRIAARV